ncbi:MAG TPA: SMC-Scp complex subunit ScpB [Lachnospiraceae bacterium]|jgi:segregation and condensation protein B|nr:segregation and condensation protein B [Butyrivibrio sp. CAG:318]HJI31589.1 SMC-Scp complex subunit ScpB [Lachnospiraceae bacterium]
MEQNISNMEAAVEAVLFTMGTSVETSRLAAAIEQDEQTTRRLVRNMMDKYNAKDRGICIIELEDSFQMCTKKEYYDNLIRVVSQPKKHTLTDSALETLSIIAYKQPVTRLEVEQIRGVKSDYAVNKLLEYNLITELGRLDAPGRPILFGTTEEFLRSFGLSSVEDLPELSPEMIADFKLEAEQESQLELDI